VTHDFALLTPEKVVVSYRLAGVGSRAYAQIIDSILALALSIGAAIVLSRAIPEPGLQSAMSSIVATFGPFAYFALFESLWSGQTPGKKAMRIRVRMVDGTPVLPSAALFRNLLRPADFFPALYLAGVVAMFANPRSQRIGDLAAGTIVVHEPLALPVFHTSPHMGGEHPLEHAVGDLPGITPEEYAMIKQLCDRFPELPPSVQRQKLEEIWAPFCARRGVPSLPNVHPLNVMEAVVMRYGRTRGLL
jgi:uncharacterized RDD family membrane protein YckC